MKVQIIQHVDYEKPGHIARWLERSGVTPEVTNVSQEAPGYAAKDLDALVIMGGPMGVYDEDDYGWLAGEKQYVRDVLAGDAKVLGICLGAQILAEALGAEVYKGHRTEIGWGEVGMTPAGEKHALLKHVPVSPVVLHWHGDTFNLPDGAVRIFSNEHYPNQGFIWKDRVLALQFHMEFLPGHLPGLIERSPDVEFGQGGIPGIDELLNGPFADANKVLDVVLDNFFTPGT
jgi:GMP synthase-like glutamine amidotransferase